MPWTRLRLVWPLLICVSFFAPGARGQKLVYMVSYTNTPASFRAQFPNGVLGATPEQRVAMVRQRIRTEVWSVSVKDGKRERLFSDGGMSFEIVPGVDMGAPVNGARNVAYVRGIDYAWQGPPKRATQESYEPPSGIYEVALNGSNRFRRLFDAPQNMALATVNAAGTRAAVSGWEDNGAGYFLYVYDLPSGKLLARTDIKKILQAHCGECIPGGAGWFADGKRLFFTMEEGDADDPPGPGAEVTPGNYMVSAEGGDLGGFPARTGEVNLQDYWRNPSVAPYLIRQTENGNYVFHDSASKKDLLPRALDPPAFVVITGADFKIQKQIALGRADASQFELSCDGSLLAFAEDRQLPGYKAQRHLWIRNLQTGEEKEALAAPPANPRNSPNPNVTVTILGWLEN